MYKQKNQVWNWFSN